MDSVPVGVGTQPFCVEQLQLPELRLRTPVRTGSDR